MPYVSIDNFSGGLDTRRDPLAGEPGTLQVCTNAHITRGGEIEKRKAMVAMYTMPAQTYGLHAVNLTLWTFGSGDLAAAVNAASSGGVNYQRLQHKDGVTAMADMVYSENFSGKIYAIARFVDGNIYGYYDGVFVSDWDTVAIPIAGNNASVATAMAALISANPAYSAIATGSTITITATQTNTSFTATASADHSQTMAVVTVQTAAAATGGTPASAQFDIVSGTEGPDFPDGTNDNGINSIVVNGVEILNGQIHRTVKWSVSNQQTAQNIAAQINSYSSSPDYTATAVNATVVVTTVATGMQSNGYRYVINEYGDARASNLTLFSGGSGQAGARAQITTVTIGGAFDPGTTFNVTLQGLLFTYNPTLVVNQPVGLGGPGITALTFQEKLYVSAGSTEYFSALDVPNSFSQGTGSGFISISNQDNGNDPIVGSGIYLNQIVLYCRRHAQIWVTDPDPAKNQIAQTLKNFGTMAARSIVSVGDTDLFCLMDSGVRSLRVRNASNAASVSDVGTAIDPLITAALASLTDDQASRAFGIIEPVDGRYLLALGPLVYVYSSFESAQISAWSVYDLGFTVSHLAQVNKQVWARSSNTIYLYGGLDGQTYDSCAVEAILPFLSAATDATIKQFKAVDALLRGTWSIWGNSDPEVDHWELLANVTRATIGKNALRWNGHNQLMGLRFTSAAPGPAKISKVMAHYDPYDDI